MTEQDEDWRTPTQVAEQLGIGRRLIYDWLRSGLLRDHGEDPEVRRDEKSGRLLVRLSAAADVDVNTRLKGRPRKST